jgi:hypothetical protein
LSDAGAQSLILSCFALYVEMFRWRHVVLGHTFDAVQPDPYAGETLGGFVRSVVASAVVVPPISLALLIANGVVFHNSADVFLARL